MRIYTKTGDAGETGLYSGERVKKNCPRIHAIGALDELNASIGMARALAPEEKVDVILAGLQHLIFRLGADVATVRKESALRRISSDEVHEIESTIDSVSGQLPELRVFILPGGSIPGAQIHVCRTVCRRAERSVLSIDDEEPVNPQAAVLLNRMSDLLFVLARWQNLLCGVEDPIWTSEGARRT